MHVSQEINVDHPELDNKTEEADIRIFQHAAHAVANAAKRLVILSTDTDILVLSLYYWHQLHSNGLVEMWMRAEVANSTRYIPLHNIATNRGNTQCSILPAVHTLTGCDSTKLELKRRVFMLIQ